MLAVGLTGCDTLGDDDDDDCSMGPANRPAAVAPLLVPEKIGGRTADLPARGGFGTHLAYCGG